MSTSFEPLLIRKRLRAAYAGVSVPAEFGPDGWTLTSEQPRRRFIITAAPLPEFDWWAPPQPDWWHASISAPDEMPTYRDLCYLHAAVFGDGYAYQVFAPAAVHVNIHPHALHLWGRADGRAALPEFAAELAPGGGLSI